MCVATVTGWSWSLLRPCLLMDFLPNLLIFRIYIFFVFDTMVQNKLKIEEKACAIALLQVSLPVIKVSRELQVSTRAMYDLNRLAVCLPPSVTSRRKVGSGHPRKATTRTDHILKREVMKNPKITAVGLKKKHPDLLQRESCPAYCPASATEGPRISRSACCQKATSNRGNKEKTWISANFPTLDITGLEEGDVI